MHLELFSDSDGKSYTVIVDGMFARNLCVEEALGVVASALYGKGRPQFVKTYEEELAWRKWAGYTDPEPVAMLVGPTG